MKLKSYLALLILLSIGISGCGFITGRGEGSSSRWILGLPYYIQDHFEKDKLVAEVKNQQGYSLQLLQTKKYQTYYIGDGSHADIKWLRFDVISPENSGKPVRSFKFGVPVIPKLVLGADNTDFVLVFLAQGFTRIFIVSSGNARVTEITDYDHRLNDPDETIKKYCRRAQALKLLPRATTKSFYGEEVQSYQRQLGDLAIPMTLALTEDEFQGRDELAVQAVRVLNSMAMDSASKVKYLTEIRTKRPGGYVDSEAWQCLNAITAAH